MAATQFLAAQRLTTSWTEQVRWAYCSYLFMDLSFMDSSGGGPRLPVCAPLVTLRIMIVKTQYRWLVEFLPLLYVIGDPFCILCAHLRAAIDLLSRFRFRWQGTARTYIMLNSALGSSPTTVDFLSRLTSIPFAPISRVVHLCWNVKFDSPGGNLSFAILLPDSDPIRPAPFVKRFSSGLY